MKIRRLVACSLAMMIAAGAPPPPAMAQTPQATTLPTPGARRLGVAITTPSGAYISQLEPGALGERAGLRPGDIVLAMDDRPIKAAEDLVAAVAQAAQRDQSTLRIIRAGVEQVVEVVWPAPPAKAIMMMPPAPQPSKSNP